MSGIGGALSGAANLAGAYMSYDNARRMAGLSSLYYSGMASASQAQTRLGKEQLGLAREQWDSYRDIYGPVERAAADEYRREIDLYRPLKEAQVRAAQSDLALYRPLKEATVAHALDSMRRLTPVEEALAAEAGKKERPDIGGAMGRASAEVHAAFDRQDAERARRTQGLGLQAAQTAFMDSAAGLEEAAAEAAARTRAARGEEARAAAVTRQRRLDALGLMRSGPDAPFMGGLRTRDAELVGDPRRSALGLMDAAGSAFAASAGRNAGLAADMQRQAQSSLNMGLGLMNRAFG